MTRDELLKVSKPILFNGQMVRAILDGCKTVTRRAVPKRITDKWYEWDEWQTNVAAGLAREGTYAKMETEKGFYEKRLPYWPGDYLYVRETWAKQQGLYWHKAGLPIDENGRAYCVEPPEKWKPSIHMPKEAARIFLKVTDARVERLQDISYTEVPDEGIDPRMGEDGYPAYDPTADFIELWDSTIKPKDHDKYGWDANPWVWRIKFERVEVEQ